MKKLTGLVCLLAGMVAYGAQAQSFSEDELKKARTSGTAKQISSGLDKQRGLRIAVKASEPTAKATRPAEKAAAQPRSTEARTTTATRKSTAAAEPREAVEIPDLAGEGTRIDIPILFDSGSSSIRPSSREQLAALCAVIREAPEAEKFYILGHTDSVGGASFNLTLSQGRAEEVRRVLVEDCGVASTRLQARGFGESRPLPGVPGQADDNRRVEVLLNMS